MLEHAISLKPDAGSKQNPECAARSSKRGLMVEDTGDPRPITQGPRFDGDRGRQ